MSNYPGYFITFEGGEGCGKSTQFELIVSRLELLEFVVIRTKEPGSPHLLSCVKIREILLNSENHLSDQAELMLYIADRTEHIQNLIKPNLLAGKVVVLIDTTIQPLPINIMVEDWIFGLFTILI